MLGDPAARREVFLVERGAQLLPGLPRHEHLVVALVGSDRGLEPRLLSLGETFTTAPQDRPDALQRIAGVAAPLHVARRTLHTGDGLLTDKQKDRLAALFALEEHVEVETTWAIYQRMIAAYREPNRARGRELLQAVIDSVSSGVPAGLTELITLGRTLSKRAADVLAYFDRPGRSNGPTEAINGRLEHLRGSALGFRNLTNYIARSLLETGGFRPRLHPEL
ncbi:hypothetical protein GCM10009826_40150 [Humibacillus xanthopallidus]